ncbi:uncharacterized protein BP01DRAFT_48991 [Aspergillus saccharolyticus JOP 1030-1]|uniref:Uncharacterized protein n=1 Tax=Aspergillus saccharolyticus JOP 1030-1 TaxID=1450539 RepID=A0A318ZDB1_9EURO|nr:hypothetical protein BP01DRAFT_48991 [Aspergillus saccharolyticus JOP 1030-1]PYH45319.1 hypothetical protein BP01DRAFT_48991 [Aspergillus saccharolyticus JOP 1030-1]
MPTRFCSLSQSLPFLSTPSLSPPFCLSPEAISSFHAPLPSSSLASSITHHPSFGSAHRNSNPAQVATAFLH